MGMTAEEEMGEETEMRLILINDKEITIMGEIENGIGGNDRRVFESHTPSILHAHGMLQNNFFLMMYQYAKDKGSGAKAGSSRLGLWHWGHLSTALDSTKGHEKTSAAGARGMKKGKKKEKKGLFPIYLYLKVYQTVNKNEVVQFISFSLIREK